jgi:hypothetical protein
VSPSTDLKTETDPVSEMLCFLVFRIPDDGQSPGTSAILRTVGTVVTYICSVLSLIGLVAVDSTQNK